MPVIAQAFEARIGGFGGSPSLLIYTADLEEVEIVLCLKTAGNARVTFNEAGASLTNGISLVVDQDRLIRVARGQRLYVSTDDTFNQQVISIIIQPISSEVRLINLLEAINNAIRSTSGPSVNVQTHQKQPRMTHFDPMPISLPAQSNQPPEKCDSLANTLMKQGLKKIRK